MSGVDISASYEVAMKHGAVVQAVSLAGLVALLYDHVLTLNLEVDLIWRAPVGFVSVVFLLNRYVVPLILIVDTYEVSGLAPNSMMFCKVWTVMQSYLTIVSFISIHAIMAIRVYALHNGRAYMRWLLWISGTLYLLSSTVITTVAQIPIIENLHPAHHQCVGTFPSYLWVAWLPTVVFESLLFILTLVALLEHEDCDSLSSVMLILYRDGMLYFVAVTFCSTFSLLVWALAPPTLSGLARYFALAIVNITGSRMVLNLKSYAAARRRARERSITSEFCTSFIFIPWSSPPLSRIPYRGAGTSSHISSLDLEMHATEQEYQ